MSTPQNGPAHETDPLASPPDARDIAAELAAPPRRKLPWPTLVLAGAVVATLGFVGGVQYQKGEGGGATNAQGPRAGANQGQFPGGYGGTNRRAGGQNGQNGQGLPNGQGGQGGFTRGTVKQVDGSTVYLTDANGNTVKVTTTDATKVQLSKQGKAADLTPGQSVTVVGTPDGSGGYAATQLTEGAGGFPGGGAPRQSAG
ncbi:hypothetical protein ACIA8O_10535 [Kitasatospora sp. NPDC051853]|uniref:hypothetical protein n=1 Tax=Kitasatospora sp. NPDC051853 TaxID=3364058 RepID=UPI0037951996